ncbi:MAG: hypothetical protein ACKVW3_06295 [Phycisphaerales bacterium]
MNHSRRTRMANALALCGPLAVVALTRFLFLPAPHAANAGPLPVAAPIATPALVQKLSTKQAEVVAFVRSLERAPAASPMDHGPQRAESETPLPTGDPLEGLTLRTVFGNAEGGMATINGNVYRPGDKIRPGLVLKSIDARASTIDIETSDGKLLTLKRQKQGGGSRRK